MRRREVILYPLISIKCECFRKRSCKLDASIFVHGAIVRSRSGFFYFVLSDVVFDRVNIRSGRAGVFPSIIILRLKLFVFHILCSFNELKRGIHSCVADKTAWKIENSQYARLRYACAEGTRKLVKRHFSMDGFCDKGVPRCLNFIAGLWHLNLILLACNVRDVLCLQQ